MDALRIGLPIAAQIGVLLAILAGTLAGERLSKRTRWGFVLWLGCCIAVLPMAIFTDFFEGLPGACAAAFTVLSSGLMAEAYVRRLRMERLK